MASAEPTDVVADGHLRVQICYLAPGVQVLLPVVVPACATVRDAVTQSGVLDAHPEIDISTQKVGIYGKVRALDEVVQAGDRIEIYRPLTVDPKVARARRVAKTRRAGSREGRKWVTKEHR
ncbi:RnfH family protein [Robbsia andropogonis]|uniref:RnfH family protein n=1 Tax=Robbsia andropogonis TaxID=28092 RepID=UPI000467A3A8|nr:RnfH family protein [Robbsia andropogonis]MCP1117602.1 RnfH family protein [Robbsia andropogonis]MCP1127068.1 RnfH family protein [Robbsia andropogonis]